MTFVFSTYSLADGKVEYDYCIQVLNGNYQLHGKYANSIWQWLVIRMASLSLYCRCGQIIYVYIYVYVYPHTGQKLGHLL